MRRLAPIEPLGEGAKTQNDLPASPDESLEPAAASRSKKERAAHACESCRSLKVRCLAHPNPSIQKCQRCARLDHECLIKPRAPRKPRKRTDTRVEELERKVEALKAAFRASSGANATEWSAADSNKTFPSTKEAEPSLVLEKGAFVNISPTSSEDDFQIARESFPQQAMLTPASLSSVRLTPTIATRLFEKFMNDIMQHFPLDLFPEGEDASIVRETQPTLFLAVITAAVGDYDLELHSALNEQLAEDFAKRIIIDGERSIELAQALICAAAFYQPPDTFEKLKYYQYIHMAWAIASDLCFGSSGGPAALSGPQNPSLGYRGEESGRNASRRTLIASYMSCLS